MNVLIAICIFEFILICFLCLQLYRLAIKSIEMQDKIEDSLDLLEEKYKKMSAILERPVFFDSVEIRQVVSDIYDCQISLYNIMDSIGSIEEYNENEEEKEVK